MKPNNMPHAGVVRGGAKSQSEVREKPGVGQNTVRAAGVGGKAKEPMSTEASMGFLASEKKNKIMGTARREELRSDVGDEIKMNVGIEVRGGVGRGTGVGVGIETQMGVVASNVKVDVDSEEKGKILGSEVRAGLVSEVLAGVRSEVRGSGLGYEVTKGGLGGEVQAGLGSEVRSDLGMSEVRSGLCSAVRAGVGSEMKGGVGSEMKGGVGSEMKGGVGSATECHRPGPRRSPLLRLSGFNDFNVPLVGEEIPVLSRPSLSPLRSPRRFSWQKPSRIQLPHRVRSISASGPSLEYDITRLRSLEVGELYRSGLCRGIGVHTPDRTPTDHFPDLSPAGRGLTNLWETDARDEGGPESSVCPRTLRQESVTYEESIPVIVRRRGCTLTVRIVSVEDIEVLPREHNNNNSNNKNNNKVAKALPHQPKSLSTLSLPQMARRQPVKSVVVVYPQTPTTTTAPSDRDSGGDSTWWG
ncbi:hypothetical protein Pmani_039547 [Petrolisthes manimaculis]|uniref:Uncharacterized protein n=1 Tax=Petrolisthes manimaculis TaxID=1843537 RepID=A0AAE1NCM7_9EUCA|nr:hypothetical protein Pmani_039547 [Petrolisthes manimaculis]